MGEVGTISLLAPKATDTGNRRDLGSGTGEGTYGPTHGLSRNGSSRSSGGAATISTGFMVTSHRLQAVCRLGDHLVDDSGDTGDAVTCGVGLPQPLGVRAVVLLIQHLPDRSTYLKWRGGPGA